MTVKQIKERIEELESELKTYKETKVYVSFTGSNIAIMERRIWELRKQLAARKE